MTEVVHAMACDGCEARVGHRATPMATTRPQAVPGSVDGGSAGSSP
ncbi:MULTISPECIES: hypothetical protein [Streptomyces]|uniref:Uncharacterized protein n=1 Tax=Streptomyces sp. 900129855 TaxID=3155129 RepID=A0ABV2ZIU3_9ACTN